MNQNLLGAELIGIIRRDRARRTRKERFGKFLGKFFVALVSGFFTALFYGWLFMLAAGVIHAEWITQLPTLGYGWAVLIAWLLRGALATDGRAPSKDGAA